MRHAETVPLTRFWFEFDLATHRPPAPSAGARILDGGAVEYRWLSWGAGVTARDERDALALLRNLLGVDLPTVTKNIADVVVDREALGLPDPLVVGNPARRGVWFPAENPRGLPRDR